MMETAKKISGSNKRESPRELAKNETAKTLPFSFFLNFETTENILGFTNQCYETVQTITASFDFYVMNKTEMSETPKDISNLIVCNQSKISILGKMNLYVL